MSDIVNIIAPVPGIFYRQQSPNDPPYVNEGDLVTGGDIIGMIEVMKNFYEVTATQSGILERFTVQNEDIVDAGQEIAIITSA